jgi:hypothetical protein
VGFSFKFPSPVETSLFHGAEEVLCNESELMGIIVNDPHDTFPMTNEIPNPSDIEVGGILFDLMDARKVLSKGSYPGSIDVRNIPLIYKAFQVEEVSCPLVIFGEQKKFLHTSKGNKVSLPGKGAHIHRSDVSRQFSKGVVFPKKDLSPIRKMVVAKRIGTHRPHDDKTGFPTNIQAEKKGDPISKTLQFPRATHLPNTVDGKNPNPTPKESGEIY